MTPRTDGEGGLARPEFYISVVRGLEDIAADEMAGLGAVDVDTRPGKVFFRFDGDPRALLRSRSAMNVFAYIAEQPGIPADESARAVLEEAARRLDLAPALSKAATLAPFPPSPSFRITAARSGKHEYTSQDVAAWTGAGVQSQTGWRVDLTGYDYEIEVEVVGANALFGLHLGPPWQQRRRKAVHHPASLNPTVAYGMLALMGVGPHDTFLDPVCGGGTLLTERAALGPARLIVGGDLWERAIEYARQNLEAAGAAASLVRWDAGQLPLRTGCIDRAAANLPFGHRIGRGPVVRSFYRRLLPELSRVLRPGGQAVLLTSRRVWLTRALADVRELRRVALRRIILGGKQTYIFLVSRQAPGAGGEQRSAPAA